MRPYPLSAACYLANRSPMARLSLTLLGGLQARLEPGGAVALPMKKGQALLAYLAVPIGKAHPRGKLAALLWGGIREESARNSLRQALFGLRKVLVPTSPPALILEGDTVALDREAVNVDVAEFESLVSSGTPRPGRSTKRPSASARTTPRLSRRRRCAARAPSRTRRPVPGRA